LALSYANKRIGFTHYDLHTGNILLRKIEDNQVYIKYPWLLEVGNDVWIGEGVRIDNLALVKLGSNVCVSQNDFLLTGNHNYRSEGFELMIGPITIEDAVWVGASSVVCPNSILSEGSIITVGSTISGRTIRNCVYRGNPAINIKPRYK
jgi:putative colanic acid biosynthesis acetyltransferase WcaF